VAAALATLPRRHRQVVVLHYLLDLPVQEVARQLAVPVGTVKSRLARARSALAVQLDVEPIRHGAAMDRLKDRLAALAEEVGELARPPGVAVTVWRARRRRRALGLVTAGLLSVVVVGLAVPIVLLPWWGTGQGGPDPSPWASTTASYPQGQAVSGYFGPLMVTGHGRVAAGEQLMITGEGCFPGRPGAVSLPGTGIRKPVEIVEDGSVITTVVVVPRSTKPGTYEVVLRCHVSRHTLGQAAQHVVIRSVRGHPGARR
jgi:Sigma-70, region 4